jgi:hypothetical protein
VLTDSTATITALTDVTGVGNLSLTGGANTINLDSLAANNRSVTLVGDNTGTNWYIQESLTSAGISLEAWNFGDTLELTGSSLNISNGLTDVMGITTLTLTGGHDTVDLDGFYNNSGNGYSTVSLVGDNTGDNYYKWSRLGYYNNNLTLQGSGDDTLELTSPYYIDNGLTHVSGMSVLSLTGSSNYVTLDNINIGGNTISLVGANAGSNAFFEASLGAYAGSLVGTASDMLVLTNSTATINGLASISGIGTLSLTGGANTVNLDSLHSNNGSVSLVGDNTGTNYYIQQSLGSAGISLVGGNFSDTLELTGASLDISSGLDSVSGIGVLTLTGGDATLNLDSLWSVGFNGVSLVGDNTGDNFYTSASLGGYYGYSSLAGTAGDTLNLTGDFLNLTSLSGVTGVSVLTLTGGNHYVDLDSLAANNGSVTLIGSAAGTGNNTYLSYGLGTNYTGSLAGSSSDTLNIYGSGSYGDSGFASLSGISNLWLSGDSTTTLGSAARQAGINSVTLGGGFMGGGGTTETVDLTTWNNGGSASITLSSGNGGYFSDPADTFILGNDISGNAFGTNGQAAYIKNFTWNDTISLRTDAGYSLQSGSYGGGDYNTELLDGNGSVVAFIDNKTYGMLTINNQNMISI